eukprot:1146041-Pelagomonas_calceolata.AAC.7
MGVPVLVMLSEKCMLDAQATDIPDLTSPDGMVTDIPGVSDATRRTRAEWQRKQRNAKQAERESMRAGRPMRTTEEAAEEGWVLRVVRALEYGVPLGRCCASETEKRNEAWCTTGEVVAVEWKRSVSLTERLSACSSPLVRCQEHGMCCVLVTNVFECNAPLVSGQMNGGAAGVHVSMHAVCMHRGGCLWDQVVLTLPANVVHPNALRC